MIPQVSPGRLHVITDETLQSRFSHAELAELAALDDAGFRKMFSGSPVKRIGRDRFVRNVLYAIGNSGDNNLAPIAQRLTSDSDATVRDAARWAVARLDGIGQLAGNNGSA